MGSGLSITGNTSSTTPSPTDREARRYDVDAHLIVKAEEISLGNDWLFGGVSDLRYGERAAAGQPAPFKDPQRQRFDLTQLFLTFGKGDWSVSLGRRYMTVLESEPVHEHPFVTHSHIYNLFQPLTVTVATIGYKDCHVGVFQGWDAVYNKDAPSLMASLTTHTFLLGGCTVKPSATTELTIVGTADRGPPPGVEKRYYVNAFGKWAPSQSFYLGADILHGGQEGGPSWDEWSGVALHSDFVPLLSKDGKKKDLEWATRVEWDRDKGGRRFTGPAHLLSLSTAVTGRLFEVMGVDFFVRGEMRTDQDLDGNRPWQGKGRDDQIYFQVFAAGTAALKPLAAPQSIGYSEPHAFF